MTSPPGLDETHDPGRRSWVAGADGHAEFPVQNLPFGIFSPTGEGPRAGVAIGDHILDLRAAQRWLPDDVAGAVSGETLNALFALPAGERRALRRILSASLCEETHRPRFEGLLHRAEACVLHLPAAIGDYSDFYAGIHHAGNVGRQFRPDQPLLENYKHVPIGYHGRASSVRPSGVAVTRPNGQSKPRGAVTPGFGPSRRLDYELELGIWIGPGNALGEPIPIGEAEAHIAGFCLLNDWSARDLQAWEYQPLGPFLAKSFHTTISPWVVTAEAMLPFRMAQPLRDPGDPRPLDYLWDGPDQAQGALALTLEAALLTATMREAGMTPYRLSRVAASNLYWTVAQLVTHHASNGCDLRPGDLLGTGTISSKDADGRGSLQELTQGGSERIMLPTGEQRGFLENGDEIVLSARAQKNGFVPLGFGQCRAIIKSPDYLY